MKTLSGLSRNGRLRVVLYLRVSTDEQAREGHSLEAQLKACLAFAASRGWDVNAICLDPIDGLDEIGPSPQIQRMIDAGRPNDIQKYAGGRRRAPSSGKTDRRPGFQHMIAMIRMGQADVVLTHKLDRFSRSITDVLAYMREFNRANVAYTSATEQFDFTTPIGKVMLTLLAAFAEWYLDNLSAETKKGKRTRAEKGFWNGDLPFGYRVGQDGVTAEPDPETAPVVVQAFMAYAKGDVGAGDIARLLNEAGHRTRNKRRNGPQPFGKDAAADMLVNVFYSGRVAYKGQVFPGKHQALVSDDIFEQCQAVRRRKALMPRQPNPQTRIYPLSRLLYCADCRRPLRGQHARGRRWYRDPDREYDGTCTQPSYVQAEEIEAQVAAILTAVKLPEDWDAAIAEAAIRGLDGDDTDRRRQRAEEKVKRANELYVESLISREEFDRRNIEARVELDSLKPVPQPDIAAMAELIRDLPRTYEVATPAERQRLFQAMLERAFVRERRVVALQPTPQVYALLKSIADPTGIQSAVNPAARIIPPATPLAHVFA